MPKHPPLDAGLLGTRLGADFYDRVPMQVAVGLLGKLLFAESAAGLVVGRIVETEAYLSTGDPACHTAKGLNRKNATMFGPPAHGYVYTIHARHCFNAVTEAEGVGSAILIRAVEPLVGLELMRARRRREAARDLARGPARLCEAFGITPEDDGVDLVKSKQVGICDSDLALGPIRRSPRIGVTTATEMPLRFYLADSPLVSGPRWLNDSGEELPGGPYDGG